MWVYNVAEMKIFSQELGNVATNAFLFFEETSGQAVLFDAPIGAFDWINKINEENPFELQALYLTHGHYDHIFDGWKFTESGVSTFGHKDDQTLFEEPDTQRAFLFGEDEFKGVKINHWLTPGESLDIIGHSVEVRHVPGHCPGNVLFYISSLNLAVVGDAIFAGSIGRVDLPGGSMQVLEQSIRSQIYSLPDETHLLPGHGPATTVGREKVSNPFVRE